jgi:hypothetical protein
VGLFADWQPPYAEHGIATFPVVDKRPCISGYLKTRVATSARLIRKFPNIDSFGFACRPAGITILDIDSPDENILRDALDEFGQTSIIVRSASGGFHVWYKNSGEPRLIRPFPGRPIDLLGDGFIVAPPSKVKKGDYELISGSLADRDRLPRIRGCEALSQSLAKATARIVRGQRNDTLWRLCMRRALACSSPEELVEFALGQNVTALVEPLEEAEVRKIAASAWTKELRGENWFGRGAQIVTSHEDVDEMLDEHPDAFILYTKLRRHHWGLRQGFHVANEMAKSMSSRGWTIKRLAAARGYLLRRGKIKLIRCARKGCAALYRFG